MQTLPLADDRRVADASGDGVEEAPGASVCSAGSAFVSAVDEQPISIMAKAQTVSLMIISPPSENAAARRRRW